MLAQTLTGRPAVLAAGETELEMGRGPLRAQARLPDELISLAPPSVLSRFGARPEVANLALDWTLHPNVAEAREDRLARWGTDPVPEYERLVWGLCKQPGLGTPQNRFGEGAAHRG